jgi:hypothetical protein
MFTTNCPKGVRSGAARCVVLGVGLIALLKCRRSGGNGGGGSFCATAHLVSVDSGEKAWVGSLKGVDGFPVRGVSW